MTRVLFLAFGGRLGGAELWLLALFDQLGAHGYRPLLAVGEPGPLADEARRRGIPCLVEPRMAHLVRGARDPRQVAANAWAFGRVVRRLARAAGTERASLVHAFVTPALKYGGLVGRLAGLPTVGTLPDILQPPFGRVARRVIAANVNLLYDRLVVPSGACRAAAVRAGVSPRRVTRIPNGIDPSRFPRDADAARAVRAEFGLAPAAPMVGMAGRFLPSKGHDVLLRAFASITDRHPDARVVLVGGAGFEGERTWEAAVRDLARELDIADRVLVTGWRDDVPRVLHALDVLVQPSTGPDTSPTTVLEAMAAGTSVVGSAIGGVPEFVADGETGLLVPPGDDRALANALLDMLADRTRRRAMGEAGRARALGHFTLARSAAGFARVYDGLLGR